MKRYITSIVAVFMLVVLAAGQVHAQPKIDKNRPIDPTAPVQRPPGTLDPLPKIDVLGLLTIKSLAPYQHIGSLQGVIESAAAETLQATCTFSRWNGKTWTPIGKTKTVTVPAKKTAEVTAFFRRSPDAERLRLTVTNTLHKVHEAKELRLAALPVREPPKFGLRYSTKD